MPPLYFVGLFFVLTLIPFLFSYTPLTFLFPQLIAVGVIFAVYLSKKHPPLFIYSLVFIVSLIVFSTHGLSSPYFFLVYFLLFAFAFREPPFVSLPASLILVFFLAQSLNSAQSLFTLSTLLLITPLAMLVSRTRQENVNLEETVVTDNAETYRWYSLKLKPALHSILDSCSQLLSQPQLTTTHRQLVHSIKDSAKALLKSSQKLTDELES